MTKKQVIEQIEKRIEQIEKDMQNDQRSFADPKPGIPKPCCLETLRESRRKILKSEKDRLEAMKTERLCCMREVKKEYKKSLKHEKEFLDALIIPLYDGWKEGPIPS